jgi:hypothetical protein
MPHMPQNRAAAARAALDLGAHARVRTAGIRVAR